MKVAIVYDRVNKWGGAERVLVALHEIFPEAKLYTSVYDPKRAPWAKIFPDIKTSFLQKFPFAKSNHELLAPLMPFAFESLDLTAYDLIISVTSEAAKGVRTRPGSLHICYCLTPTRYLWSHYGEYFKNCTFKAIAKPFIDLLRRWDKRAAKRPDKIISISSEVQKRIKKYYKRNSQIIFPPVRPVSMRKGGVQKGKYYLIVSRLVSYKKVDLAIKAFNKLKMPLLVVGSGRDEKKLKRIAGRNIKFAGQVSEESLPFYYMNAKALIMPQEEDFGIVSIEAQSYGIPVIAYKKGGAVDTVIPGKTGVFFEEQKPEDLVDAIKKFEKLKFNKRSLNINASRFSEKRFRKEFVDFVKNARMSL